MSDMMIITKKELNYIETLYLYCNIEDFVSGEYTLSEFQGFYPSYCGTNIVNDIVKSKDRDIDDDISIHEEKYCLDGSPAYNYMLKYIDNTIFSVSEELGKDRNGYYWYKMPNYRIGIMGYERAKRSNQFNCIIQYEQSYMFTLDKELNNIELPLGGTRKDYHIKRIDITKIFKSEIDYTIGYNYISPYRNIGGYNRSDNTVYLGNRKNGNVFRMYPKTIELKETENYKKIELLSSYFGDIEELYTFELELHRKYLKGTLAIETLADLEKVYKAYNNIVGSIRIYEDNDHNKSLLKRNKRERIKAVRITEFEKYERVKKKRYRTSKKYAIDKILNTYTKYSDSVEQFRKEPLTLGEKYSLVDEIATRILEAKVSIEIEYDSNSCDTLELFQGKMNIKRANQTKELQKEAIRAFAPTETQNPSELF